MNPRPACLVLALLVPALSCGKGERPVGASREPAAPSESRSAGMPAPAAPAAPAIQMPAAPAGAPAGAPALAPPAAGGASITWTAPAEWVEEQPSSPMRRAQYRVPGPGGDAECQIFYFGPGQGGDAMENAKRWGGQFTNPDGTPAIGSMTTSRRNVNGLNVLIVEAKGTYSGGMAMPGAPAVAPMPEAMLIGAIAEGTDSNWFFKLIGPEKTVKSRRDAFMGLVRSLKPAA